MSILVRYAMTDSPHTIGPEMNAATTNEDAVRGTPQRVKEQRGR